MKTLYLVDGHAQFFRAFHAIRTPMSSPATKEPTNATFGFVGMLLKALREIRPDYLAVAIDVTGDRETFRSEMYPAYKATREAAPEALGPQIRRCISLLGEIGVPVIGCPGFEADDVLATIVSRERSEHPEGLLIRIVSKDKDLQQLLESGRVEMYDIPTEEMLDEARLRLEKGVTPGQVIDLLALTGDTADNVPGVAGVGPKTAAELIGKWGSVENLMAHAGEIEGKRGENIRAAAGHLPLSKILVTLRHDAPVEFSLEEAAVSGFKIERLLPILKELGFRRYQDEVRELLGRGADAGVGVGVGGVGVGVVEVEGKVASAVKRGGVVGGGGGGGFCDHLEQTATTARVVAGEYSVVRTRGELAELVGMLERAEIFAVDTETTSLSPRECRLCGLSFAVEEGRAFYVPVRSPEVGTHLGEREALEAVGPLLEDAGRRKCGHNLKYDALVLRSCGVEVRGGGAGFGGRSLLFDSMVASFLVDSSRSSHSLDSLCLGLLGHANISITELIGKGASQRTFDCVPVELATPYAAEDADMALRLRNRFAPQLRAMGLEGLFEDVEMPLVESLAEMEWNGIMVDPEELDHQAERLRGRIEELRRRIVEAAPHPFNPDSPKQLAAALFNGPGHAGSPGLGLKPARRTKTGYSTDAEALEKLAADPLVTTPVPGLIVEYRQLTKLVSTYLTALRKAINPRTKRVHASFHQAVAATGRLSSSDPNLQNIPIRSEVGREIRKAFIAPPGRVLISADYSQIELRLLAHLSRDPGLIEAFREGQDIHAAVAAQINGVAVERVTREQRSGAKAVNFGIVYGITPFGLARQLGIDNTAAAEIIGDYKRRFAGITTFLEECVAQAKRYGYVETILKRRRPIVGIESRNGAERAQAERVAINSVVQGSAADLIKLAMIDLHARFSAYAGHRRVGGVGPEVEGVLMLLQIHDELVFEAAAERAEEARRVIVGRMEGAMALDVPIRVESQVSGSWFEGK